MKNYNCLSLSHYNVFKRGRDILFRKMEIDYNSDDQR